MIPGEFEYHAPTSLREAQELLRASDDAKVLAGGMSLIPAMKHRLAEPAVLVDIGRIEGLDGIEERRGRITFGTRVTHARAAEAKELADLPVLTETARSIGDTQVRNRGTIGGSLVHADPAADWPAAFLALEGEATVLGAGGERTITARDFFVDILATAVGPGELLTQVRVSLERKRAGAAYTKIRQAASGFAVVGVAAEIVLDRKGRCERASVGVTGANPVPFRADSLEARLVGVEPDEPNLRAAVADIEELDPMGDIHASAEFRRHLTGVLAVRTLLRAAERARG